MNYSAKRQHSCIIINRTPYVTVDMTTKNAVQADAAQGARVGAMGLAEVVA